MIISGGKIFLEDKTFAQGSIVTSGNRITEVCIGRTGERAEAEQIDAAGLYVLPGLVDIHFHGCVGYDFCDGTKEAMDAITAYELKNGVTSVSPATMTLSREELARIFAEAGAYCKEQDGCEDHAHSTIRGITMEGPFVSMAKKGAQNGAYIHRPDMEFYRQMQELSGGLIRQVAVAPEEDVNQEFIKEAAKETVISIAHTTADYDTVCAAFAAGANHVTHLFNAMPPFHHRDPGVVGAAADHAQVYVELICDGVHIHPAMVRAAFAMFGAERICMISDSMMATGLPDGDYSLGGQAVKVTGKRPLLADGTIAGSASNLLDCFRVAVREMKIPLADAAMACTSTPAKSLGLDVECGSIREGKAADFVLLDEELNLKMVIKGGAVSYK